MPNKPALPDTTFGDYPRIPVDETEGSDFHEVLRIAALAAADWATGPNGPYRQPKMTGAESTRHQVREALLQLLELGVIDIDGERLGAVLEHGVPIGRGR